MARSTITETEKTLEITDPSGVIVDERPVMGTDGKWYREIRILGSIPTGQASAPVVLRIRLQADTPDPLHISTPPLVY